MSTLNCNLKDLIDAKAQLGPIAGTGSYQFGDWVSRANYNSALAVALWSTSGGVTGGAVKVKVQDATDISGTGVADFYTETSFAIPAGPNAKGIAEISVDLRGARGFVRIGVDSDPTGGSPASIIGGTLVLGNKIKRP